MARHRRPRRYWPHWVVVTLPAFGFRYDEQRHAYILRRVGQFRGPVIRDARLRDRLVRLPRNPDDALVRSSHAGAGGVGAPDRTRDHESSVEAARPDATGAAALTATGVGDEGQAGSTSRAGLSEPVDRMTSGTLYDPGVRRRAGSPRRRHWGRWIAAGVVLGVLVWMAFVAVALLRTVQDAHNAQSAADAARTQLTQAGAGVLSTQSTATLQAANRRVAALDSDVSSPALTPLTVLPWVGTQIRSARAVSSSANKVSAAGVLALNQANFVLAQEHGPGPGRVLILQRLASIADTARASLNGLDIGPSSGLIGTLSHRRSQLVTDLSKAQVGLTKSAAASRAAADMLATPGQYLLVAGNNAEMRNGQGIALQAGLLTTENGTTHLQGMQSTGDLLVKPPGASVPVDLETLWNRTDMRTDWTALGRTPEFTVTGPIASQLWSGATGGHVDGVILVDIEGLHQLMTATGPVDVDGTTVAPDDVVSLLMHDQYQGLGSDTTDQNNRREMLGSLSRSVFSALQGGGINLKTLATGLAHAANGRHMMVWTASPKVQSEWETAGAAGQLQSNDVLTGLYNYAGNKLDWFLKEYNTLQVQPGAGHTDVTVTMHLSNQTPDGEPQYVAGGGGSVPPNQYSAVASVNIPAAATNATMNGNPTPEEHGREGATYLLGQIIYIDQGKSQDVTVRFQLPGEHGQLRVVPAARVPDNSWDGFNTFDETGVHTVSW